MHTFVVVGHDGSLASRTAVRRACQVGERVMVVSSTSAAELFDLLDGPTGGVELRLVPRLHLHDLFEAAAEHSGAYVVMPLHVGTADKLLRLGMQEAAALARHGSDLAALHLVRDIDGTARPYRRILVAADGSVGSPTAVEAALAAAGHGALVRVVHGNQRAFGSAAAVRDLADRADVDVTTNVVNGDPARVLLDAVSTGGYGLIVSALNPMRAPGARSILPTSVSRTLVSRARVDHLLVFAAESFDYVPRTRTAR
ncbi:MAG: universal stress protein [Acidimicrobiia bacterium]